MRTDRSGDVRRRFSIRAPLAVLLLVAVGGSAWLSDDSLITLRTVENCVQGHGLRWNAAERTMTYSHPLWCGLLFVPRLVTGELYFGTIALGGLLTLVTVAVMVRIHLAAAALLLAVMASSRAFVDFSTSGLENPLSHLLLVSLLAILRQRHRGVSKRAAVLFGLLVLTRHDLVWLGLPLLGCALWSRPRREWLIAALLAGGMVLAWLAFATIYYGSPWPTTAYAKAFRHELAGADLVMAGLKYALHLLYFDPVTALTIAVGIVVGCLRAPARLALPAIGCLLQLAYVIAVGGDFMAGRFFTPLFVVALWILGERISTHELRSATREFWLPIGAVVLALLGGAMRAEIPANFAVWRPPPLHSRWQVFDERAGYQELLGLWSPRRVELRPGLIDPVIAHHRQQAVAFGLAVGWFGLLGGPRLHVVDPYICDPLLVRLPVCRELGFRPGHYTRRIPEGYLESLAHGDNRIEHAGLRRYYDSLRVVLRAPIWSGARWRAVSELAIGSHDAGLFDYLATDYVDPPLRTVAGADLRRDVELGKPWFESGAELVYDGGVRIDFGQPQTVTRLAIALQQHDSYRVQLSRDGRVVRTLSLAGEPAADLSIAFLAGFDWREVDVAGLTFDAVIVRVTDAVDRVGAIAAVRVGG
ncbi:MAG: hypothetical protein NXI31_06220 [bacterium]|nr:hypothetical protein [bacterium]